MNATFLDTTYEIVGARNLSDIIDKMPHNAGTSPILVSTIGENCVRVSWCWSTTSLLTPQPAGTCPPVPLWNSCCSSPADDEASS